MSQTILITGATGALGRVVVAQTLQAGHKVLACGRVPSPNFSFSKNFKYFSTNLSKESDAEALISNITDQEGPINAAFLLAGGFVMGDVKESTGTRLENMLDMNFRTAYYVARPLFLHMCGKKSGHLCFIGAKSAVEPQNGGFALSYTLSKSLLLTLVQLLEAEGKPHNVRSNLLIPSIIDTSTNREAMPDADFSQWVTPQQIAESLLLLISSKTASWRENIIKMYNQM